VTTATTTLIGTPDRGEITVTNPDVFFTARGVELECVNYTVDGPEKVTMVISPDYLPYILGDLAKGVDEFGRIKSKD
jgi:hypothetical protein